jgi:hypothetical protein
MAVIEVKPQRETGALGTQTKIDNSLQIFNRRGCLELFSLQHETDKRQLVVGDIRMLQCPFFFNMEHCQCLPLLRCTHITLYVMWLYFSQTKMIVGG